MPKQHSACFGALGRIYHAYQYRDAALACYQNAQLLNPADFRWPYYLGRLQKDLAKPDQALNAFHEAAAVLDSHQADAAKERAALAYWIGETNLTKNNLDDADLSFNTALTLDPRCAAAIAGLGRVAVARSDSATAIEHFRRAVAIVPAAGDVHYRLGLEYRKLGDLELAKQHLGQHAKHASATLGPHDPLMDAVHALAANSANWFRDGGRMFQAEQYADAAELFHRAIDANPKDTRAHGNLAASLMMLGDTDGAMEHYRTANTLDPDYIAANYGLGVIHARLGRDEEAVKYYQSVISLNPVHVGSLYNSANSLARLSRFEQSIQQYERVIELDPSNESARLGQAMAIIQIKEYANAIDRLEEAIVVCPRSAPLRIVLAKVLAACPIEDLRDGVRSLGLIEEIPERLAQAELLETQAMAQAEQGAFEEAVSLQRRAIAVAKKQNVDLSIQLDKNLERYLNNQPCREPFAEHYVFASSKVRQ